MLHVGGHRLQLFEPRLEVRTIRLDGLHLPLEHVEHVAEVLPERARAGGARTFLSKLQQSITLIAELGVLRAEGTQTRVDFLAVTHPLGAARLQLALRLLECGAPALQLKDHFLLERRCTSKARTLRRERLHFEFERRLRLHERTPASVVHGERPLHLELGTHLLERRDVGQQRRECRACLRHLREIECQPLFGAPQRRRLTVHRREFGLQTLALIATRLRREPLGGD